MAFSAKGKGRQSTAISRLSEGADVLTRALRDGTLITSDWKDAAIMGGFGYQVIEGSFSTGQTGGGQETIIDIDKAEMVISVPNGYSILPLRIDVVIHPGSFVTEGNESEILIAVDQDKAYDGTGTCDALTVHNMNTNCGKTTACTVVGGCSVNMTAPVLDLELARIASTGDLDGATPTQFVWHQMNFVYEPKTSPVISGPAMVCVYFGGTAAATGFITAQWLEFQETVFSVS